LGEKRGGGRLPKKKSKEGIKGKAGRRNPGEEVAIFLNFLVEHLPHTKRKFGERANPWEREGRAK